MDCARFDRRLDALLDGSCTPGEWREAEAHAAACPRCRSLLDAMSGFGARQDEAGAASLEAAVLARTSGATCGAARERLCDLVDGALDGIDRELVEAHLARCRPCAELASALARATRVLPGFAELEAPAGLEGAVLAATSRRPPVPSFDERVAGWAERLAGWFERLAARPRISLEAAYVCTLLIFVIVGNPVAAFRETSARGRELAQPRVERVLGQVSAGRAGLVRELRDTVERRAAAVSGEAEAGIAGRLSGLLSSALGWAQAHLVGPVRRAAAAVISWVSELVRPNPRAAGRVTQAEGRAGGAGTPGRK